MFTAESIIKHIENCRLDEQEAHLVRLTIDPETPISKDGPPLELLIAFAEEIELLLFARIICQRTSDPHQELTVIAFIQQAYNIVSDNPDKHYTFQMLITKFAPPDYVLGITVNHKFGFFPNPTTSGGLH